MPNQKRERLFLKLTASVLIGLLLLAIWFALSDLGVIWDHIRNVNLTYIMLGLVFYTISYVLRSYRWKLLLSQIKDISLKRVFMLFMTGNLINFMVPIRLGELAKAMMLKKVHDIPISLSLPSILLDKIADLLPVMLILLIGPFLAFQIPSYLWLILVAVAIILAIAIIITVLSAYREKLARKLLKHFAFMLPLKQRPKINKIIDLFIDGFSILKKDRRKIFLVMAFTLFAILSDGLYFYLFLSAFKVHLSYLIVLFGYTIFVISFILPTPPAQIGSNEMLFFLIFSALFGAERNAVSSAVIVAHALTALIILGLGFFSMSCLGMRLFDLIKKGKLTEKKAL